MTCRAIEQMIKEVAEQTHEKTNLQILQHFHQNRGYSLDTLFEALEIPEEKRAGYAKTVMMTKSMENAGRVCKNDPTLRIFRQKKEEKDDG